MIKFLGLYSFSPQLQYIFICDVLFNFMGRMEVKINVKIPAVFSEIFLFCVVSVLGMKIGLRNFEGTYQTQYSKGCQ